jgi:hypothetical protein
MQYLLQNKVDTINIERQLTLACKYIFKIVACSNIYPNIFPPNLSDQEDSNFQETKSFDPPGESLDPFGRSIGRFSVGAEVAISERPLHFSYNKDSTVEYFGNNLA